MKSFFTANASNIAYEANLQGIPSSTGGHLLADHHNAQHGSGLPGRTSNPLQTLLNRTTGYAAAADRASAR